MIDGGDLVAQAQDAASAGDWDTAYELLAEADARGALGLTELPLLANFAYAAGHLDTTIDAWERAYTLAARNGDEVAAAGAATRVAMHLLMDTALMAPIRGWLARAERHLQGQAPSAIRAWFAVARCYERLLSGGDVGVALHWAREGGELGARFDAAAAACARMAEARCLMHEGQVREGLVALDEAGVAVLSGELDPVATGMVYCELVCALQALGLYELSEEWTAAYERWARTKAIGSMHGRCRVHRAEILRLRGACREAEREAVAACEELRPYLRRELGWPLYELGRIRLQQGNLAGAEATFLEAHEHGWDPQPGLAMLYLSQGKVALASSAIRAALDHPSTVPSKELHPSTELRRAPLLEAEVAIAIAVGEPERARQAAAELTQIAARFETKALVASSTFARGQVELAAGDAAAARKTCELATHLWNEIGAPYETALARMALAEAHRALGDEELAQLELRAARATLERIGAEPVSEPALPASPPANATDVFRCEGDTWCLTFSGRTVRLNDLKGLRYLARLLAAPGHEYHVLELVQLESGGEPGIDLSGDAGPVLDGPAKEVYRRRLAEIDDDIAESTAMADLGRREQATAEREFLLRELSRAVGLGGRDRRIGSAAERARVSVTRALRQAIARIREHHAPLAEHFGHAVRTGTYCAYLPDPKVPVTWTI